MTVFKNALRILLVLAALMAGGAMAQDAAPPAEPSPAAERAQKLVAVLRDDTARAALIDELERLAAPPDAETPPGEEDESVADIDDSHLISFGRRIALLTQETAESLAVQASQLWGRMLAMPATFTALDGERNLAVLIDALKNLALVIVITYATFILLRRIVRPVYRRMGETAADAGSTRTFLIIAASTVIDAFVVVVAWALGYALTVALVGEFGTIGIRQTLYLNAFLVVEMIKVAMRFVLSPTTGDLRLIAIGDRAARYLSRWLNVIISILGYGQLLVIPIVNQNVSFAAGSATSVVISLIVLLIALALVLRNRRRVADWLSGEQAHQAAFLAPEGLQPDAPEEAVTPEEVRRSGPLRFLALHWHWPVIAYLAALFVIVVSRPDGMLFPVLGASGKILLAILIGMIVTGGITRAISHGVTLPGGVNARLPLLERRLNRFVPAALMVVRFLVILVVIAFTLDILGALDFEGWLESQVGVRTTATIISTAFTLLFGFLLWLAITSWIDYRLNPEYGHVPTARETTLLSLLRNAVTVAVIIITTMFALSNIGLDIAPLLASAGVLGLAIGFGAQKMVQDIITGIFIQFESAINVGDVITVAGTTGTVERLTIRSVSLRDLHGAYHIIPFSSVDMVSNFMRDFAYFVCDMGVAYREDTGEVRDAMMDAFDELAGDASLADGFLGRMEWMGVTTFGDNAVTVRARLKTKPGRQWAIGRAYNAIVKRVFDERGIEMPFPHRTIYFGEDKSGAAPAARIAVQQTRMAQMADARGARADRDGALADGPPEHGEEL
jgi:small-conductance mechanosensitive channel